MSLAFNLAFGIYNGILGFVSVSWWFITVAAYYIILGTMRFAVLMSERGKRSKNNGSEVFIMRFTGVMFLFMSLVLSGTVVLTSKSALQTGYDRIVMITLAVYAFFKATLAVVNIVKARNISSYRIKTLRNISLADAAVSIFSLQRSMLVSFKGCTDAEIYIFNIATGTAVCILVIVLGINLLRKKEKQNGKIEVYKGE